jgi:hypothetical protein
VALSGPSFGCSSFDGGSDVLAAPPLMTSEQMTPGADWSCLADRAPAAVPVAPGPGRIVYSVQMLDLTTRRAPSGLLARACILTDVECAQPVSGWVPIDPQGWLDIPLPQGFFGYLEIMGDNTVPGTFYPGEALEQSTTLNYPGLSLDADSLEALTDVLGLAVDPSQGQLAVRAFDCDGSTAPDVVLSKVGAGQRWYFAGGLPSVTATRSGDDGFGGFVNVPPGVASVDAQTLAGQSIGGTRSVVVRAGWFSVMFVRPPGAPIAAPGVPAAASR